MKTRTNTVARRALVDRMKVSIALEPVRDAARFLEALNAMGCSSTPGACSVLNVEDVVALIGPATEMLNASLREFSVLLDSGKSAP